MFYFLFFFLGLRIFSCIRLGEHKGGKRTHRLIQALLRSGHFYLFLFFSFFKTCLHNILVIALFPFKSTPDIQVKYVCGWNL